MGRKKGSTNKQSKTGVRSKLLTIRLSEEQYKLITELAVDRRQTSISKYVLESIHNYAVHGYHRNPLPVNKLDLLDIL